MMSVDPPDRMTKGRLLRLFNGHHAAWSSRMQFRQAVADIGRQIAAGATSQAAVVLAEETGWRTALIGLAARAEIPLHDHPHTRGLLFVEKGAVELHRFDVVDGNPPGCSVVLAGRGRVTLRTGEHDWIGKRRHNLHALKAGDQGVLIFSVRQSTGPTVNASLYALVETGGIPDSATRVAIMVPGNKDGNMPRID